MERDVTVVLLSGGTSSRFWPFQDKNTFIFQGKKFLSYHYEQLTRAGIKKCIVITNEHTNEIVRSVVPPEGLHISFVIQKGHGMGQAVASLDGLLREEPILILNASDYYSDNFMDRFVQKIQKEKKMVLGAVQLSNYFPGGYLRFNADKTVAEIIEKPPKGKEPSDIGRIVADFYPKAEIIIDAAQSVGDDPVNGYEKAMSLVIANGLSCQAEITEFLNWCPMKYPWHVLSVMAMMFPLLQGQQIHPRVEIKKNVFIEGAVVIEEGVKIMEGTKIVGPVYIGKNTIIGNNNLIRQSHIGASCMTGFNSDITRSYIGDNCWFHTNYIGDSVIGSNVSIGSGTVCANLRLDDGEISSVVKGEKISTGRNKLGAMIGNNVRIGVNTSIMPGVKIGNNSFIGAGIVIDSDLEDGKFVFLKNGIITKSENTKHSSASRDEFRKAL